MTKADELNANVVSAVSLLRTGAIELNKLIKIVQCLEVPIDELLNSKSLNDTHIKHLQSLDYLLQSLQTLEGVFDEASDHTPKEWRYTGLQSLKQIGLTHIKDNLIGTSNTASPEIISGHFEDL